MFHLNKPLKFQLEKLFPDYLFNKSSEPYLKESINNFFNLKLSNQEITFSDFCFYFSLNTANTNDIKDFPTSFLQRYKEEFFLFLNPVSYKLNTKIKILSEETNFQLNLINYITNYASFLEGKFNQTYSNLFNHKLLDKYVYKNGDLKKDFFIDFKSITPLDIDTTLQLTLFYFKQNYNKPITEHLKFLEGFGFFVDDIFDFTINSLKTECVGDEMYSTKYEIHVSISNKNETKEFVVDLDNQYRLNRLRDFQTRKTRIIGSLNSIKVEVVRGLKNKN